MEKYVYVIFESKWDNWSTPGDYDYDKNNYRDRFIGIFDSYEYASDRLSDWRKSMMKRDGAISEAVYSDESIVTVRPVEEPKGFDFDESKKDYDYEVVYIRKIKVFPLQTRDL